MDTTVIEYIGYFTFQKVLAIATVQSVAETSFGNKTL